MRLVRFLHEETIKIGALKDDHVVILTDRPVSSALSVKSMADVISGGSAILDMIGRFIDDASGLPLTDVELLAPIDPPPHNVFCVGLNYLDHVKEGERVHGSAVQVPEVPHFFTKASNTISPPQGAIPYWSRITQALDYEVELAVILSRGGRDIARDEAANHIFGYMVANDVTARDLQVRHGQWFKGKSLDGSLPLGPCIVTSDEIDDVRALELSLTVNGEVRLGHDLRHRDLDRATLRRSDAQRGRCNSDRDAVGNWRCDGPAAFPAGGR
jgi:2-keto-4-pentenoate hydratase/2-oxohepta-3-ene-1,7-dioic acid hydratase in catechol pathway